jgi:Glu-tRNA(Gln) amidotransferase subunit E-like FAD-binding protein
LIDKKILKNPLENLGRLDSLLKEIGEISNKVEDFFDKNNTNNQLREEFFKKLREVFCEPMLVAIGAENTKNWLLQHENKLIETISNTDDQSLIKDQEITINNIHSAFSNHWWDSDEKKAKSMVDLYYGYVNSEDVPNIIKQYIYFSVEELLKKNPSLFSKVKELQEAHEK